LEKLEEEHLSLLKEKFDIVARRRKAEDEDDLSLFLGHIPQPASEEPPGFSQQERSAARLIRRTHLRQVGADLAAEEGSSTDLSLSSDQEEDFELAITKLKEKGEGVLGDVRAGEFRDPSQGLGKWFGEWKDKYEDIYVGAWGGLGLVGAWEFWARLEIVGWNPFQVSACHHCPRSWKERVFCFVKPPHRADSPIYKFPCRIREVLTALIGTMACINTR